MENITKESEVLYDIFKLISDRNESQKRQVSKVKNILVKKQHVNLEMRSNVNIAFLTRPHSNNANISNRVTSTFMRELMTVF